MKMPLIIAVTLAALLVGCSSKSQTSNPKNSYKLSDFQVIGPKGSNINVAGEAGSGIALAEATETMAYGGLAVTLYPFIEMQKLLSSNESITTTYYFSYLIVGSSSKDSPANKTYESLADTILTRNPPITDLKAVSTSARELNLFVIPTDESGHYDLNVAMSILEALRDSYPNDFKGEGPYIITSTAPFNDIFDANTAVGIHYFDLSGLNPHSMPQLVDELKNMGYETTSEGVVAIPVRPKTRALSLMYDASNSISVAREEFLQWVGLLESGKAVLK
ncbi:hypothetical protein [Vibrio sp. 10N.261.51.F12]|uniref:hypothetical protein n=1 Tax=Vibrio sp. 10N.261.51.F12 TaxID=3229679 RepID=UPI00355374B0